MANGHGFAYRATPLDRPAFVTLLGAVFGSGPVFAYATDVITIWELQQHAALTGVPIDADFGQIFTAVIELRWRRDDSGHYDVLGLTEQAAGQLAAAGMRPIRQFAALAAGTHAAIRLEGPSVGNYTRIDYIEYRAPSGAVQLLRYAHAR